MKTDTNRIDALVAGLASVRDDDLVDEAFSARARTLLTTIMEIPSDDWQRAEPSRTGRGVRPAVLATAVVVAVLLSGAALGVAGEVASLFAGWRDPDAPVPAAPDVVIASGEAGVPWRIVATTSDHGLCLALVIRGANEDVGLGGCGPTDVRGDPWAAGARHWIGAFGIGGGPGGLDRTFAFGPVAEGVASVELILDNGQTLRAHIVQAPDGLNAPLNVYWAAWPCGSSACGDARGPQVETAIVRDSAGRVLERRLPSWSGNPTGDPNELPPPRGSDSG